MGLAAHGARRDLMTMDALNDLREVEAKLKARLAGNPDFVAWSAIRKAINEITNTPGYNQAPPQVRVRVRPPSLVPTSLPQSQADAAYSVLKEYGEPLYVGELLPLVQDKGVVVGGANKEVNLSSALSRDKRFRSIRINSRHTWWLRELSYPGEVNFAPPTESDENAAQDSAEDDGDFRSSDHSGAAES